MLQTGSNDAHVVQPWIWKFDSALKDVVKALIWRTKKSHRNARGFDLNENRYIDLFPEMFEAVPKESIIGRAVDKKLDWNFYISDYSITSIKVDDYPMAAGLE